MPANSNIVKTINNSNRFGPQPGASLMNRSGMTGEFFINIIIDCLFIVRGSTLTFLNNSNRKSSSTG